MPRPESEWWTALDELCAGDDSLPNEVESLLAHERAARTFLETPAIDDDPHATAASMVVVEHWLEVLMAREPSL